MDGNDAAQAPPPRVADGIELIGKYEGSGFKEAPYLARRTDGQVIQLPHLLYLVAEQANGQNGYEQIANTVSEQFGRGLSADNVHFLVTEKLAPLGVLQTEDGSSPELKKLDPMLALKFRAAVVPERLVQALTNIFKPLFLPPVIAIVLGTLVALDVWLFGYHGVAQSLRQSLYDPAYLLILLGLVVISAAFHEMGHATACAYGGAKPGVMGAGIYIVWPAFYTDVTDAYRLGKGGRLRTDLGGVYFNVVFMLAVGAAYLATGFEPLLLVIPLMHIEIVHQFLPFIRLDGYYIVSDLTGVPDMFSRIKPTLQSLVPGRKASDRVTELKPWVRAAVTLYVFTVIPILLFMFGMMVINAPRIFATAYDALLVQYDKVSHALDAGKSLTVVTGGIQMAVLALPCAGIVASFLRFGSRLGRGAWTRTQGRPVSRLAFVLAAAGVIAFMGYIWYPNGDYKPIQPGEKGTLSGAVSELANVGTGRPALTKQQELRLHGAPMVHGKTTQPKSQGPAQHTSSTTTTTPPSTSSTTTPSSTSSTTSTTTPSSSTSTTTPTTTTTPAPGGGP